MRFLHRAPLAYKSDGHFPLAQVLRLRRLMEASLFRVTLLHRNLTQRIIGVFFDVYRELGGGFLETVYRRAFEITASSAGLEVCRDLYLPVWFRGSQIGEFYADFCVGGLVLVEIKAKGSLEPGDEAQLINYLRASDKEVGLLLNFGRRAEYKRRVYENSRKRSQVRGPGQGRGSTH